FAMEVILGNFAVDVFGPVVIASALATTIARFFRGGALPVYAIPGYTLVSARELPAYILLGALAGVLSIAFTRGVRSGEALFSRVKFVPPWLKPLVGMVLLGGVGLMFPEVYG